MRGEVRESMTNGGCGGKIGSGLESARARTTTRAWTVFFVRAVLYRLPLPSRGTCTG